MALAGRVEPTVGFKCLAQRLGGRQLVDGAINGKDGKPLPSVLIGGRPQGIGQTHGILVQLLKGRPGQLSARFGYGTAMDRLRRGPEAAPAGVTKESAGLGVHPLVFAADREGEQEDEQQGKGKFPMATKRRRRGFNIVRGKPVRN